MSDHQQRTNATLTADQHEPPRLHDALTVGQQQQTGPAGPSNVRHDHQPPSKRPKNANDRDSDLSHGPDGTNVLQHANASADARPAGGLPSISAGPLNDHGTADRCRQIAPLLKSEPDTLSPSNAESLRGQLVSASVSSHTCPQRLRPAGLHTPEFDDEMRDINAVLKAFPFQPPVNSHKWSICVPGTKRTGWEPLEDCIDHVRDESHHLRIHEAVTSYRTICKEKGQIRSPPKAKVIGRLHVSSFGQMFAILWASRHHMKPRRNPEDKSELCQANEVVLDFMDTVARSRSAELPQKFNQFFDAIREGCTDDPFMPYDFQAAVIRWWDGCPSAAKFLMEHPSGPVYFQPEFLNGCRRDIRDAYQRVAEPYFAEALDWARMRFYQVQMHFQSPWTPLRELSKARKELIVKVRVNQEQILQYEQVMFTDSWGAQFADELQENVQAVQLPDVTTEAIVEAKKYFLGQLVRKLFWFGSASAFNERPEDYIRLITEVTKHFSCMFPYVNLHIVLPPYTANIRDAWHNHLHNAFQQLRDAFPRVNLIMHPTDANLCAYFDKHECLRQRNLQWPSSEQDPTGQLSVVGIRRRKEFMEAQYAAELWQPHRHEIATEQPVQKLEVQNDLPGDSAESNTGEHNYQQADEPAGSTTSVHASVQFETLPSGNSISAINEYADAPRVVSLKEYIGSSARSHLETLDQLLARLRNDANGEYKRRIIACLQEVQPTGPAGPTTQPHIGHVCSLRAHQPITATADQDSRKHATSRINPNESYQSSTRTQEYSQASADATPQAAFSSPAAQSIPILTSMDELGSLIEGDEESQLPDNYEGRFYGHDRF